MKGATTTEILVALALGIMILLGLGYLFWQWMANQNRVAKEQWCRAQEASYCSVWASCNYQNSCKPKSTDNNGMETTAFTAYAKGCEVFTWANNVDEQECRRVLGVS